MRMDRFESLLPIPLKGIGEGDFREEVTRILKFLQDRIGFDLWMVTRVEGNDWIVLDAQDRGYNVNGGDVFKWADSFCSRMVKGEGPQIAPDSDLIPAYVEAEIGNLVNIRAYIGVQVNWPDGSLFGTLCAIDPEPKPRCIMDELPLLNVLGGLIGKLLESELRAQEASRYAECALLDARIDPLTGLRNRLAWEETLINEEARASRLATPVAVIVLELDDLKVTNDTLGRQAGDDLLVKFAELLVSCSLDHGMVFRTGLGEFVIMLLEAGPVEVREVLFRVRAAQLSSGLRASSGVAMRDPKRDLSAACERAYLEMYGDKRRNSDQLAA